MVLTAGSAARVRRLWRIRFAALVVTGMLLAHDAVFAAQHGLGGAREDALGRTAHGYWPVFAAVALLAGIVGLGTAAAVLARLQRAARGLPPVPTPADAPGYGSELLRLWPRLFLTVGASFVAQENIEHVVAGQGLPGLWVLSWPAYPLALPVLAGVTALLAAIGAWLRWRTEVLTRRLAAARAATRHGRPVGCPPAARWRLVGAIVAHARILARPDAGRAPPVAAGA